MENSIIRLEFNILKRILNRLLTFFIGAAWRPAPEGAGRVEPSLFIREN
jgi:hypothetical protein